MYQQPDQFPGVVYEASPAAMTDGQRGPLLATSSGVLIVAPTAVSSPTANGWSYAGSGITNVTTGTTIKAAATSPQNNFVNAVQVSATALGAANTLVIRNGAGGAVLFRIAIPTTGMAPTSFAFSPPLAGTGQNLIEIATETATTGTVYVNAQGFTG